MGELKTSDTRQFNYPVDHVFRTVMDIASYHKWWPREISFELEYLDPAVIGTIVDVHNGMFVRWKARVSAIKSNRLLAIDYMEGDWIGKTYWRFEETQGGTLLSFDIDLEINRVWLKAVSRFISFSRFHSRQIQKVFSNLEKYLASEESTYTDELKISHFEHIVLTVADIERTCNFYHNVLKMEILTFDGGRKALKFGRQKINLHTPGGEFTPKAKNPVPGSADICLVTYLNMDAVMRELKSGGVAIEEGPVEKSGADGKIISVYIHDPDGNLIEISNHLKT